MRAGDAAANAGGAVLSAVIALVARTRRPRKPLHPRGVQLGGTFTTYGSAEHWDVPWLDEAHTAEVTVRLSRGLGLRRPAPDILGLAIRINRPSHLVDLLFSTTGTGRLTRFVLVPRRSAEGPYGALMPYRTPTGPVMLAASLSKRTPSADLIRMGVTVRLFAGRPRGRWHEFARVDLPGRTQADDPPISFDPVLNAPPGLPPYAWTRRLRERAYAAARRYRSSPR